ncbi:hypothetical protein FBEOM_10398 [Fusarium beomiforme]|uniref:Uncharacterized protein n=1 Tax=Fusarium beomiforme TaxID=44412 RepID=A0A9P5AD58_9HYPO|nr:hypothetical protein FBEOM_10398 [Fusarium beomiforme]
MAAVGSFQQALGLKELVEMNLEALYASIPATKLFLCKRGDLYVAAMAKAHTCGHGSVLLQSIGLTNVEGALRSLLEETAKELTKEMDFEQS